MWDLQPHATKWSYGKRAPWDLPRMPHGTYSKHATWDLQPHATKVVLQKGCPMGLTTWGLTAPILRAFCPFISVRRSASGGLTHQTCHLGTYGANFASVLPFPKHQKVHLQCSVRSSLPLGASRRQFCERFALS
jgi:hypothetical protein